MLPPDLSADLPAPRDDEPASLRQDIADELADHLHSAFLRELHSTRDEATAAHDALARFGDPKSIARKLWLDAMQEKIMWQRMTFVTLLVVVLASVGSTGLAWLFVTQAREANQAMLADARAANERLLAESRDANEALMTKLKELSTAGRGETTEKNQSLEWNAVKVRLYSGPKPGKPLAGFEVRLTGHILDTAQGMSLARTTDGDGIADFGLVRPGQHSLSISTPWKESCGWQSITVYPGQPLALDFACPPTAPPDVPVDLTVEWPEEIRDKGYWLACRFVRPPRVVDGRQWIVTDDERIVLINSEGGIMPFTSDPPANISHPMGRHPGYGWAQRACYWPFVPPGTLDQSVWSGEATDFPAPGLWQRGSHPRLPLRQGRGQTGETGPPGGLPVVAGFIFFAFVFENAPAIPKLALPAVDFRLRDILVMRAPVAIAKEDLNPRSTGFGYDSNSPNTEDLESGRLAELRKCIVVGGLLAGLDPARISRDPGGPRRGAADGPLLDWIDDTKFNPTVSDGMEVVEARARVQPAFTAHADMPNHWQIPIPTRLAGLVAKTTEVIAKGAAVSSSTNGSGENGQD